jgi:hypothetical protein
MSAIIDMEKNNRPITLFLACLGVFAIAQTWLLPLPAVVGSIALAYFTTLKSFTGLKHLFHVKRVKNAQIAFPIILAIFGSLFQVYIFIKYSPMDAGATLNNDGGIFWISNILFGVLTLFTTYYWMGTLKDRSMSDKFLVTVMPILFLCGGIFLYQLLSEGKTSYYFVKSLGLAASVIGVFFVPAFTKAVQSVTSKSKLPLSGTLLSAGTVLTLLVATGQTTLALNGFLQRNSKITSEVASEVEEYLENYDVKSTQLAVFGGENFVEDSVATYLANRTAHIPNLCVNDISINDTQTIEERLERLKDCAHNNNNKIVVITSNYTFKAVKALNDPDLTIVNVP